MSHLLTHSRSHSLTQSLTSALCEYKRKTDSLIQMKKKSLIHESLVLIFLTVLQELQELLLFLFLNHVQIPRQFEVKCITRLLFGLKHCSLQLCGFLITLYVQIKNPQFIRDVVVVHFSSCGGGLTSLGRESSLPLHCVRNHKFTSNVKDHAHHLLTVSILDDLDDTLVDDKRKGGVGLGPHGVEPYVLPIASLRSWGFPMPPRAKTASIESELHDVQDSKKRKLVEVEGLSATFQPGTKSTFKNISRGEGYWEGVLRLPSLTSALSILDTLQEQTPDSVCLNAPNVKYNTNVTDDQAQELVPFRLTAQLSDCSGLPRDLIDEDLAKALDLSVVAIDCEMCDTASGPELTRVSVVDYNGMVVLDCLVKPHSPILDYKEAYSGMTATLLDSVSVRIEQIQVALLSIMTSSTVIVGHSLESDLHALRMVHQRCIDTAVIFPHRLGYPHRHKLKFLAKEYLNINIQNASSTDSGIGHSSVEDARVALQLMKLKVQNGPLFGIKSTAECPREPLVSKIPNSVQPAFFFGGNQMEELRRGCVGHGVDASYYTNNDSAVDSAILHLQRVSNRENLAKDRNFTYIEVLCDDYKKNDLNDKASGASADNESSVGDENPLKMYSYVDRIKSSLATCTNRDVLLVVTTQASIREVRDLLKRKQVCSNAMSASSWSAELEDALERSKMATTSSDLELTLIPAAGYVAASE